MGKGIDEVYSPETLRKLQMVEWEILKKFDAMCQKYDLQYFALYGTTLGQIRHGGIIPWDDDIDIGIMRKDYDRLKELVPKEFGEGYTFIDGSTEPSYPFATGRIMKNGTEFRMLSMKNAKFTPGIFLDIFPIDWLPDDPKAMERVKRKCWVLEKMNVLRNQPFPNLPYRGLKRYVVRAACAVAAIVMKLFPRKTLQKWMRQAPQATKGQETGFLGWPFGIDQSQSIYPKDMVFPLQRLPFEDSYINMPRDPHGITRMVYGDDYMTPPPEGKRSYIVPYKLSFGDEEAHV